MSGHSIKISASIYFRLIYMFIREISWLFRRFFPMWTSSLDTLISCRIINETILVNLTEFFNAEGWRNKLKVLFTYCGGVLPRFMRAFEKPLKWTQQVIISCSSPWNRPPYNADLSSVTVRQPAVLEHPSSVSCYHFQTELFSLQLFNTCKLSIWLL